MLQDHRSAIRVVSRGRSKPFVCSAYHVVQVRNIRKCFLFESRGLGSGELAVDLKFDEAIISDGSFSFTIL